MEKKKEKPGSLLWFHICLKWLTLGTSYELLVSSSSAVCHDVQQLWQTCFTDIEAYVSKWIKTGSVVRQFDSKRMLLSFNIECQETQLGESLIHDKSEDIVKFNLS